MDGSHRSDQWGYRRADLAHRLSNSAHETHIFNPAAFTRHSCHIKYDPDVCEQYDIALLRVKPEPTIQGHHWWFTPAAETREQLLSRELKNRGYPSCALNNRAPDPDAPANCEASGHGSALYGDTKACALGDDLYPSDPESPVIFHTCDTNLGHSGSPIFYYSPDGRPVLVGVHIGGDHQVAGEALNSFRRFTSNTLKWINGLI